MKMVYLSFRWNIFLKVTILSDKRNCVLILIWITVFKKLSETLRIIVLPILLIVSNWFWLNFYTMKFSRFNCRISDSLFILPHPGNIVKRFFQLFSSWILPALSESYLTAWLSYHTKPRTVKHISTFLFMKSNFSFGSSFVFVFHVWYNIISVSFDSLYF